MTNVVTIPFALKLCGQLQWYTLHSIITCILNFLFHSSCIYIFWYLEWLLLMLFHAAEGLANLYPLYTTQNKNNRASTV